MYASFFVLDAAQALLLANWLAGWAALASVLLLYVLRVPAEEAMMLNFFGGEYESYIERTGGVVPRWRRARAV
jgi:protein-S-isoprenylcysteine O-methyltransferase Ste14